MVLKLNVVVLVVGLVAIAYRKSSYNIQLISYSTQIIISFINIYSMDSIVHGNIGLEPSYHKPIVTQYYLGVISVNDNN